MRNPFRKKPTEVILDTSRLDRATREQAVLKSWKDYKPKWQARETISGKYTLSYEVPTVILGSSSEEDKVILVWKSVGAERLTGFTYLTPPPSVEFDTLKDVEVFLRRKLHPNNVEFDSNGDRIK